MKGEKCMVLSFLSNSLTFYLPTYLVKNRSKASSHQNTQTDPIIYTPIKKLRLTDPHKKNPQTVCNAYSIKNYIKFPFNLVKNSEVINISCSPDPTTNYKFHITFHNNDFFNQCGQILFFFVYLFSVKAIGLINMKFVSPNSRNFLYKKIRNSLADPLNEI